MLLNFVLKSNLKYVKNGNDNNKLYVVLNDIIND